MISSPLLDDLRWMLAAAPWLAVLVAFLASAGAALVLRRWAPGLGWVDTGDAVGGGRKWQPRPVPAVGGAAVLIGLAAGWLLVDLGGRGQDLLVPGRGLGRLLIEFLGTGATLFPVGGVLAAFAVGLADDLAPGGLRPGRKALGQAFAGAVLAGPLVVSSAHEPLAWGAVGLIVVGAVLAQNALNTFDNADGAATSLTALGLCLPAPLFAAPLLAFLPFNLRRRGSPSAYLGDAGSHLLGMLVLLTPAAWPVLALPLFDLARLSVVRLRRGQMPWVGDRRHLAHRLASRGLGPVAVVGVLLALAIPGILTGWVSPVSGPGPAVALGVLATGLLFRQAVRLTPEPLEPASSRRLAGVGGAAREGSSP